MMIKERAADFLVERQKNNAAVNADQRGGATCSDTDTIDAVEALDNGDLYIQRELTLLQNFEYPGSLLMNLVRNAIHDKNVFPYRH